MGQDNRKMGKKDTKISYDEKNDLLFICREGKVKGNIMVGKFVIDISPKGEVIGIEVLDASQSLNPFKITKKFLKFTKKANLIVKHHDGTSFVGFKLSAFPEEVERNAVFAMPALC